MPCHTAQLWPGTATPPPGQMTFMLLSLFFCEVVVGLLLSQGFEASWTLGLAAVKASHEAAMGSCAGKEAWMVWHMEGCFLCPRFSFLTPLNLLLIPEVW